LKSLTGQKKRQQKKSPETAQDFEAQFLSQMMGKDVLPPWVRTLSLAGGCWGSVSVAAGEMNMEELVSRAGGGSIWNCRIMSKGELLRMQEPSPRIIIDNPLFLMALPVMEMVAVTQRLTDCAVREEVVLLEAMQIGEAENYRPRRCR